MRHPSHTCCNLTRSPPSHILCVYFSHRRDAINVKCGHLAAGLKAATAELGATRDSLQEALAQRDLAVDRALRRRAEGSPQQVTLASLTRAAEADVLAERLVAAEAELRVARSGTSGSDTPVQPSAASVENAPGVMGVTGAAAAQLAALAAQLESVTAERDAFKRRAETAWFPSAHGASLAAGAKASDGSSTALVPRAPGVDASAPASASDSPASEALLRKARMLEVRFVAQQAMYEDRIRVLVEEATDTEEELRRRLTYAGADLLAATGSAAAGATGGAAQIAALTEELARARARLAVTERINADANGDAQVAPVTPRPRAASPGASPEQLLELETAVVRADAAERRANGLERQLQIVDDAHLFAAALAERDESKTKSMEQVRARVCLLFIFHSAVLLFIDSFLFLFALSREVWKSFAPRRAQREERARRSLRFRSAGGRSPSHTTAAAAPHLLPAGTAAAHCSAPTAPRRGAGARRRGRRGAGALQAARR